jgi:RNA-directed DNA polymerase
MTEAKPYKIRKQLVWDAYQRVKANRGAAGVDGESLAAFEQDLKGNLYKVWNRMSSGSYFPPPVRLVEIAKDNGGTRPLGIPTVADRVCQTVAKMVLEPLVEPVFHPGSYGYRPGKSALDAVGRARTRCWATAWVIDLDIRSFFDSLDHALVERAVAHHTDIPWVRLYIARWLRAPVQRPDGTLEQRTRGTPQGGVVSPLLANLFLHYAFDIWMQRHSRVSDSSGTRTMVRHDGAERRLRCKHAATSMQPCCTKDEGRPLGAGRQGRLQTILSCSGKEPGW